MTAKKENPATVLVGKLDRLLSEVSMLPPGEFKTNMMNHINSMCVLTLLKFGNQSKQLQFILKESSPK
jgi:hypothetical protein